MEASGLVKPGSLSFSGNVARNWSLWKREYDIYMIATDGIKKSEPRQTAMFLNLIGREGREVAENFNSDSSTEMTVAVLTGLFAAYCNPRKNTMYTRYKLWNTNKMDGESVDQFATRLLQLAKEGAYGDQTSSVVRDRIVFGIKDNHLRERILEKDDIPLDQVLDIVRASEATKEQMETMRQGFEQTVDINSVRGNVAQHGRGTREMSKRNRSYDNHKYGKQMCPWCGSNHEKGKCPAYGRNCRRCSGLNHYAKQCRAPARKINTLNVGSGTEDEDETGLFVSHVELNDVSSTCSKTKSWYQKVIINNIEISFKLDSGAEANVITKKIYDKIAAGCRMGTVNCMLKVFGGHKIRPEGMVTLKSWINGKEYDISYIVADTDSIPLLGLPTCDKLGLVRRRDSTVYSTSVVKDHDAEEDDILREYSDVFTGIGCYENEVHLETDPNVKPVVHAPRKVPVSMRTKLQGTLTDLEKQGIVKKVNQPTPWVNSLLMKKKKNGSLRLCIDPRDLNVALRREHYKIPTPDEIYSKLAGMGYFTVIDQRCGFWNLKLDETSSLLCTFNTPFGRYRFCRLPFGLSVAPEIFQKKNDLEFGDLPGVGISTDDFIIGGTTKEECIQNLRRVLDKARQCNTKFNSNKIQFCRTQVEFLGNLINKQGLSIGPDKLDSILSLRAPKDRTELRSILGFINYLSPFTPNLAELAAPLRMLNKQNAEFVWEQDQDLCLQKIKTVITSNTKLRHFDPNKTIVIQTDASQHGLGGCLMQDGEPIAYTSRALLEHECRYSQIEKEFLAISNACNKFHYYIYGYPVIIHTDHKPLISIILKPFATITPRLQRFVLAIQRYSVKLVYRPGKEVVVADLLSRNHLPPGPDEKPDASIQDEIVHAVSTDAPCIPSRWHGRIGEAMEVDQESSLLKAVITEGWPRCKSNVSWEIRKYWANRDNFRVRNGLIVVGHKIFIPVSLRQAVLKTLHEGHQGIEKSKERARRVVYWPGLGTDIEKTVAACPACQQFRTALPREPLILHAIPDFPWLKVAMDLFEIDCQPYIVIVDFYSRYPEVERLPDQRASSVIHVCRSVFARHGIPDQIIADNMPFSSVLFKAFCESWNIRLTTSSPHYPQSNGLAERFVQTIKSKYKKAIRSGTDPELTLLEYRNTPLSGMQYSPAQLSMSRVLNSKMPILEGNLKPKLCTNVRSARSGKQSSVAQQYNQSARNLRPLSPGRVARIRQGNEWLPARVVERVPEPRSYLVRNHLGNLVRRNRRHIIPTGESLTPKKPIIELSKSPERTLCPSQTVSLTAEKTTPTQTQEKILSDPIQPYIMERSGRTDCTPSK